MQDFECLEERLTFDWKVMRKDDRPGIYHLLATETSIALQQQLQWVVCLERWALDRSLHYLNPEGIFKETLWPYKWALEKAIKDTLVLMSQGA